MQTRLTVRQLLPTVRLKAYFVIQYVDASGNYVAAQPFWGQAGEMVKPTLQLPAGWKIIGVNPIPAEVILQAGEQLLQVRVAHVLRVIDEDDPGSSYNGYANDQYQTAGRSNQADSAKGQFHSAGF